MDKKSQKYDRQLRLWQAHGQEALENASVCLLGVTATGAETLKNLILPGIGSYTVVDHEITTAADVGNNFFLSINHIGCNRANSLVELLSELNEQVSGTAVEEFDLVICQNMDPNDLIALEAICTDFNIQIFVVYAYGFFGYLRIQAGLHHVIETHPEQIFDFRLDRPWLALVEYVNQFRLESMDAMKFSHTPYIVLLLKALQKWNLMNPGKLPKSRSEINQMKQWIKDMNQVNAEDTENIHEALANAARAFSPTVVPTNVSAVISHPKINEDSEFWILAHSLGTFVKRHHAVPLAGVIPDMKSDTESFIELQNIYRKKAMDDLAIFKEIVCNRLETLKRPLDFIPQDLIERFCKNCSLLEIYDYGSLKNEISSKHININPEDLSDPNSNVIYYFALRAAKNFEIKKGRWPGLNSQEMDKDVAELTSILKTLLNQYGIDVDLSTLKDPISEICRSAGCELHNMASIMGGIASQEIIKILTKQYVPLDNTIVFNGITSTTTVLKL